MIKKIVKIMILALLGLGMVLLLKNIGYQEKTEEIQKESLSVTNQEDNEVKVSETVQSEETAQVNNAPVYKIGEKNLDIPLIIYHAFQTPLPKTDTYQLFSTQERFEENVATLLKEGYAFITLEELYQYQNGEIGLPEKVVAITMDDGWLGNYTEAFPVLLKYHIPATIFIIYDLVGTPGYFSWEQAKEMYQSGLVKIHCHGKSHIDYTTVSKHKLQSDYQQTHEKIEEVMGETIQKIMAYPSGKCTENTKRWLKEAGFEVQVLTKYGTVNKSTNLDLTALGRIRGEQASGKELIRAMKR